MLLKLYANYKLVVGKDFRFKVHVGAFIKEPYRYLLEDYCKTAVLQVSLTTVPDAIEGFD